MGILSSVFGKKKSEEEQYLEAQDRKESKERALIRSEYPERRRFEKEQKIQVGQAIANRRRDWLREKEGKAIGGLVRIGEGAVDVGKYAGSTQIAQYAGARAKGALEYIPSKFEKARLDYESGKISKKKYEEAYREAGEQTAVKRGVGEEQRQYTEKIGKKTLKAKREEANRDIEISAKKAFHVEKARTSGRIAARQERKTQAQERTAFAQTQQPQFGVPPQRPRRQWVGPVYQKNPTRQPTSAELDPMGIYSLGGMQQQTNQTPKYNLAQMHALLGYFPNRPQQSQPQPRPQQALVRDDPSSFVNSMLTLNVPQQQVKPISINGKKNGQKNGNGQRKKRFNMFTGTWE